jgi:uncharacterized protein (DUF1330 family)
MSAYLFARVVIRDRDTYAKYVALVPPIAAKFGGEFIVRGGASKCLEGEGFEGRLVAVRFPSVAMAEAFYNSPEYTAAKAIRIPVSDAEFMVVEGVA